MGEVHICSIPNENANLESNLEETAHKLKLNSFFKQKNDINPD
jgi:hypothetical protein